MTLDDISTAEPEQNQQYLQQLKQEQKDRQEICDTYYDESLQSTRRLRGKLKDNPDPNSISLIDYVCGVCDMYVRAGEPHDHEIMREQVQKRAPHPWKDSTVGRITKYRYYKQKHRPS